MNARRIGRMLGTLLLAGVSCATFAQDTAGQGAGDRMGHGMSPSSEHDAMFMRHAAADSLAEIRLGRIALDKSSSARIRRLAQRIIDDHTKANNQLISIAQRKQVTLPTEPMPMQKQEADHLRTLSGSAFDRAYADSLVKDHRKAIKMFGIEGQRAADPDLKQFARTTLPVLKQHLQMAQQAASGKGSMSLPVSARSTP
ncbi:MAG TPA: DUF4142 domain-containing protein [Frateuria sp.]|uniref:DUF4142 domain-containing protein n=1 Tax=Frateuria sp. TaxID=2211372 RepID=UPI002D80B41C|nr:DUF4142 domain-containing protein [Frateuria sp.]HET6806593.1 DUF4142 domain-containing protein [Frateuria sp.]